MKVKDKENKHSLSKFFIVLFIIVSIAALAVTIFVIEGSKLSELENKADEYMSVVETTTSEESFAEQTIEDNSNSYVETEYPIGHDEESMTSNEPVAEFNYDGFEYWQQNVLNTIAKTISNCQEGEVVVIVSIDMSGEYGHMIVKKNDEFYETDFDKKSYAILN